VAYGKNIVGDFANGNLYALDLDNFTDFGGPIVRRRSFPHILNDGKRQEYTRFIADMETGESPSPGVLQTISPWSAGFNPGFGPFTNVVPDQVYLRASRDRGYSFGNAEGKLIGPTGAGRTWPTWTNRGIARDMVFELFWAAPVHTALMGAHVEVIPADS